MQSRLGEIEISLLDTELGVVRLHVDTSLNVAGRKLASNIGARVKGIRSIIVINEFIIECETKDADEMKRLARSYVRAFNSALSQFDEEQIQEITGNVGLGDSMAVHSTSGIFHTNES